MSAAIEAAMLDAHRAGLSVIPLRSNKRPAVPTWKQYIDTQPDELDVLAWSRTAEGFAILCGGTTRLQVLDFEGRFMEHIPELRERLGDELAAVFESWLDGYFVATPGGGFHVAVHVEGDDQPGNIKLASDGSNMTMVETRGHGGYVVAAPSNGTTHPSGQPWGQVRGTFSEIAWATAEQWRAICAAISTFDAVAASESPPEAPPQQPVLPGGLSLSTIESGGNSWIADTPKPPMAMVLENNGWSHVSGNYWARPDKPPREGHSATINENDRLCMFSSDGHPVPQSRNNYTETYDSIDVMGCYEFGHLPSDDERTMIFRRLAGREQPRIPADILVPVESGWLPDDFWEATEWLSEIRAAAWGNGACPEALLGSVYSASLVRIPSSIRLGRIVHGVTAPLNAYVALCGMSGSGKTSTMGMAQELVGVYDDQLYRYGINLRSGEGLVTSVLLPVPKGEPTPPTPPHRLGVQVEFDEGKSLAVQNDRSGSTMIPYLTSAWSGRKGGKVGGIKAGGEEWFPADMVRVCLVLGVQYGVAGSLFTGDVENQGFPGRFLYFGMDNLGPPLRAGEQRRIEPLMLPRYFPGDEARAIGEMMYSTKVQQEILDWDRVRQTTPGAAIDGHRMQLRARFGCWLALMDRIAQPSDCHWELAGEVERHSLATRDRVLSGIAEVSTQSARALGRMDSIRENARHMAWIEDRAVALAKAVHEAPHTARQVKDRFNKDKRHLAPEVVQYAIERNWVQYAVGERAKLLLPGESRPA